MYTGEGKDKDPSESMYGLSCTNYISSYDIKKTYLDRLQYYRAYGSNSAVDQLKIFNTETADKRKTILKLKMCSENPFLQSSTSGDLWHKWQSAKQT
jgi:hypothetical protein